jgi:hypothetical protein
MAETKGTDKQNLLDELFSPTRLSRFNPAAILRVSGEAKCLDTPQLEKLEKSFRQWAERSVRPDVRLSRKRILLVFLLIRLRASTLNKTSLWRIV